MYLQWNPLIMTAASHISQNNNKKSGVHCTVDAAYYDIGQYDIINSKPLIVTKKFGPELTFYY